MARRVSPPSPPPSSRELKLQLVGLVKFFGVGAYDADAAAAAAHERDAGWWRGTAGAVSLTPMAPSCGVAVWRCVCVPAGEDPSKVKPKEVRKIIAITTQAHAAQLLLLLPCLAVSPSSLHLGTPRSSLTRWVAALNQVLHIIGTTATECVSLPITRSREKKHACFCCVHRRCLLPPFGRLRAPISARLGDDGAPSQVQQGRQGPDQGREEAAGPPAGAL
eukprot:COSAG01_NODE_1437_length_10311_cov_11.678613_8_plen_220_part_00